MAQLVRDVAANVRQEVSAAEQLHDATSSKAGSGNVADALLRLEQAVATAAAFPNLQVGAQRGVGEDCMVPLCPFTERSFLTLGRRAKWPRLWL